MSQVVVLPALAFDDRHVKVVGNAVAAMRAIAPDRVLITGLIPGPGGWGCEPSLGAACLPSEELHRRLGEFVNDVVELKSRPSVGFVGLETEAGKRCVCWSNGQIWLEDVGVDPLPAVHELVPGWYVLGRPVQVCRRVDRAPGQAAVAVARRLQSSVIVGDTGRLGVGRLKIVGSGGAERIFTGLEAGSLRRDDAEAKVDRRRRTEFGLGLVTLDGSAVVAARCVSV